MTQMKHQTSIKCIIGKLPLNHQIKLPQMIIEIHWTILFKHFSPFLKPSMMAKFRLNLMVSWKSGEKTQIIYQKSQEKLGPQVLKMDHLRIGILSCLVPLTVSIAALVDVSVRSNVEIGIKKYLKGTARCRIFSFSLCDKIYNSLSGLTSLIKSTNFNASITES